MDLTPLVPAGRQIIESYGDLRFRVTGVLHQGSILVFPDRTEIWNLAAFEAVSTGSLVAVRDAGLAGTVDLLLVGCGPRMALIPKDLRAALRAAGVVVEAMDTGAACRTYNVLAAEGRRVAAALIAV
jgi:uncharacterized protein